VRIFESIRRLKLLPYSSPVHFSSGLCDRDDGDPHGDTEAFPQMVYFLFPLSQLGVPL